MRRESTATHSRAAMLLLGACVALAAAWPRPAAAQSQPLIGQIMCAGFGRTPSGWVPADGRLLPITTYDVLFTLIGTTYGGDGETTFAVPDLRGRLVTGSGSGPGLTPRVEGAAFGSEQHTLSLARLPSHLHVVSQPGSSAAADATVPDGMVPAAVAGAPHYTHKNNAPTRLAGSNSAATGAAQPVGHLPPSIAIPCYIAWYGIYPQQP